MTRIRIYQAVFVLKELKDLWTQAQEKPQADILRFFALLKMTK